MTRILIIFSLLSLLITGCGQSGEIKIKAQNQYNLNNPNGDSGYCLFAGYARDYPYTTTNNPEPVPNNTHIKSNNTLNQVLQTYAKIGLLNEEFIEQQDGGPIYRYSLTPLGQQYRIAGSRYEFFCFGKIIVDDVEIDAANKDNWGRSMKWFHLSFHVENIPQWVSDNYDQLSAVYHFDLKRKLTQGLKIMAGALIQTSEGWAIDAKFSNISGGDF